jgi:Transaldolase/Fructose-6-phosphate aldolase
MNPTAALNRAGQSLWLDNITRDLLTSGTLARHIAERSVTGLTSNPTIYDKAIEGTDAYDAQIRRGRDRGLGAEDLFFELALEDLRQAADAFRPVYARTHGVDGCVSLEVSPRLAHDAEATVREAIRLHGLANRPNLFIKIPGTEAGLLAIEEAVYAGVPVNVTLLFTAAHYAAAADAYLRGIERRIDAGLDPDVASVASVFISRWDAAVGRVGPAGPGGEARPRHGPASLRRPSACRPGPDRRTSPWNSESSVWAGWARTSCGASSALGTRRSATRGGGRASLHSRTPGCGARPRSPTWSPSSSARGRSG